ncbi:MAG: DNA-protecting protein DprA [Ignavibacteriales bacterium]|nr:DNA-protecting protein DprA [Ignavibacteriales bacterium]
MAIVGTRSPSHYGKETAFTLARDLSAHGISIVSGLARGIDREAHLGALDGIAGTVAVLGLGHRCHLPAGARQTCSEASRAKGAVISGAPSREPALTPRTFPGGTGSSQGCRQGVIVVEATLKSGAMITSRYALEQGKLIMAVPGNVTNVRSQGPHQLIRQGAVLIQDADDVLAEIAPQVKGIAQEI